MTTDKVLYNVLVHPDMWESDLHSEEERGRGRSKEDTFHFFPTPIPSKGDFGTHQCRVYHGPRDVRFFCSCQVSPDSCHKEAGGQSKTGDRQTDV